MDTKAGEITRDLLPQQRDQSLVFAVSPDGQRLAVHRVAEWGKSNSAILIIDRNGGLLRTIQVPGNVEVQSISWGAASSRNKGGK